jgi:hypothetical protein
MLHFFYFKKDMRAEKHGQFLTVEEEKDTTLTRAIRARVDPYASALDC